MYYLFRSGVGEAVSGSMEALKELIVVGKHIKEKRTTLEGDDCVENVDYDPNAKILEDDRWLNPADLYLDEKGNIAIKKYESLPSEEIPAETVPIDETQLAVFEAMAAQETRLAEQDARIAELKAALKTLKGGDSK